MLSKEMISAFLAGALLPTTIAFYYATKYYHQYNQRITDDDDDDEDDEDSNVDEDKHAESLQSTVKEGEGPATWGMRHAPYKMVLAVNTGELTMGKGKIAAQCCHAAVGCYRRAKKQCPAAVRAWEYTGCAKIAVRCESAKELERIAHVASQKGMPVYLVEDAGRTQIAAGSRTVLGIFGPVAVFEGVTDHLKLM
jgi:PTH2 family peptidyl-tRNA hydrolase